VVDGQQCEILTLHASDQWRGVGSALVEAVKDVAVAQRCVRLTVTTTNDNVDALRFYQPPRLRPGQTASWRRRRQSIVAEAGDP
jgi:GNAT superfamily N-acetyltransferase